MPRDAVSRTANVERNGGHKWVKALPVTPEILTHQFTEWFQGAPNQTPLCREAGASRTADVIFSDTDFQIERLNETFFSFSTLKI